MNSEHGVVMDEKVQTNKTTSAETKVNPKLRVRKVVLQKKQSTLKRKKKTLAKKKTMRSLAMDTTLATIFSSIPWLN